jgi:uncharacterized Zn-binding protein involved in type VI secretion
MRQPAAKKNDGIIANDNHIVMVPTPAGEVAVPFSRPFNGIINDGVSSNVNIMGTPAAMERSVAADPAHVVPPPGTRYQNPPPGQGRISAGSQSVRINGRAAARHGDAAATCNDPSDNTGAKVVAAGSVLIG